MMLKLPSVWYCWFWVIEPAKIVPGLAKHFFLENMVHTENSCWTVVCYDAGKQGL